MILFLLMILTNLTFMSVLREMKIIVRSVIRGVLFACGYHRIHVVDSSCQRPGESKTRAPIVVGAPHTSFFDAVIMFACEDFPTGVSRIENGEIPFLGGARPKSSI